MSNNIDDFSEFNTIQQNINQQNTNDEVICETNETDENNNEIICDDNIFLNYNIGENIFR